MTTREHAEQLVAMLAFNIDEAAADGEDYDTAELLDELSNVMTDETPIPGYSHLVVYDIAFRAGVPFVLTLKHQRLILEALNEWLEE